MYIRYHELYVCCILCILLYCIMAAYQNSINPNFCVFILSIIQWKPLSSISELAKQYKSISCSICRVEKQPCNVGIHHGRHCGPRGRDYAAPAHAPDAQGHECLKPRPSQPLCRAGGERLSQRGQLSPDSRCRAQRRHRLCHHGPTAGQLGGHQHLRLL